MRYRGSYQVFNMEINPSTLYQLRALWIYTLFIFGNVRTVMAIITLILSEIPTFASISKKQPMWLQLLRYENLMLIWRQINVTRDLKISFAKSTTVVVKKVGAYNVSCRGTLSLCVARATQSVIWRTLWRHNYEATRNCDTALHANNTIDSIWVFFFNICA